jgi:multidrug efflux pump subunit AcrA (membrane-fusion protein)
VIVKNGPSIEARAVEIGSNNEKFVVVKSGLESGEQVLVDADNYLDAVDIPSKDAVQSSRP